MTVSPGAQFEVMVPRGYVLAGAEGARPLSSAPLTTPGFPGRGGQQVPGGEVQLVTFEADRTGSSGNLTFVKEQNTGRGGRPMAADVMRFPLVLKPHSLQNDTVGSRIDVSTVETVARSLIRQAHRWDTNRDGTLSTNERSARDVAASQGDVGARAMKSFERQLVQQSWFGHEDVTVTRGGFIGGVQRGLAELRANDLDGDGFVTSAEVKTRRKTEALTRKAEALVALATVR